LLQRSSCNKTWFKWKFIGAIGELYHGGLWESYREKNGTVTDRQTILEKFDLLTGTKTKGFGNYNLVGYFD